MTCNLLSRVYASAIQSSAGAVGNDCVVPHRHFGNSLLKPAIAGIKKATPHGMAFLNQFIKLLQFKLFGAEQVTVLVHLHGIIALGIRRSLLPIGAHILGFLIIVNRGGSGVLPLFTRTGYHKGSGATALNSHGSTFGAYDAHQESLLARISNKVFRNIKTNFQLFSFLGIVCFRFFAT